MKPETTCMYTGLEFWFYTVDLSQNKLLICLFVALRPKSTAMSCRDGQVTLPHFYLGKLEQTVTQNFLHILSLVTDNPS